MDFEDFLETPPPKVVANVKNINIDMNKTQNTSGEIRIKNIGKGTLVGTVIYNSKYISIDKDIINENNTIIKYSIVPNIYNDINMVNTSINIICSGGEVCIPVDIVYKNVDYIICGEKVIHNIEEFYTYYKENNIEAIRIFYSYEFLMWLKKINYKHIEMLDEILKDSNKRRAIDNFFILSGIKEKAYIKILEKNFKYRYYKTKNNTDIIGEIPIKLIGKGYFEDEIIVNDSFVKIANSKITDKDFDKNNTLNVKFKVIKDDIYKKYEKINILFAKCLENVTIELVEKKPIEIIICDRFLTNIGKSNIKIFNNTGENIMIEISTKDNFINFETQQYVVSKYIEIPFSVNMIGLLKMQMDFLKKPNVEGQICIKTMINGKIEKMIEKIYIGSSIL